MSRPASLLEIKMILPGPSPLLSMLIITFMIILIIQYLQQPLYAHQSSNYEICRDNTINCGNLGNLGYPFYDGKTRPQYCGYPGFEISCPGPATIITCIGRPVTVTCQGRPVTVTCQGLATFPCQDLTTITIMSQTYYVANITPTTHILTVARDDYYTSGCPPSLENIAINSTLFTYAPTDENITFFYNCAQALTAGLSTPCNLASGKQITGYFFTESMLALSSQAADGCSSNLSVPVLESAIAGLNQQSLVSTLQQGFELEWFADDESCAVCTAGGGECGYDWTSNKFACYGGKSSSTVIVILCVMIPFGICCILVGAACFIWKRKILHMWKRKRLVAEHKRKLGEEGTAGLELPVFDFEAIATATDNFSDKNKLGEGGFGCVYKGLLDDGREVAVKRLSQSSGQGTEQFKNELVLIAKLQHRNLVRLLGCCVHRDEKILIYEFLPNRSLDSFIFNSTKEQLTWCTRFNIIEGIARGLLYLHRDSRLRVIHRDLKPSNVLLDSDMNPKISDFGLARIFPATQDSANTRRIEGTIGYMSPEYVLKGIISEKSDVFSFGIMLLEIISGKKNSNFCADDLYLNLPAYAWQLWNDGRGLELMDKVLTTEDESYSEDQVLRCLKVGLLCVQDYATNRPTMSSVVLMLMSEAPLPHPKQPTFFPQTLSDNHHPTASLNAFSIIAIEGR
ncbi:hypothetical protein Dimus_032894 [Dionaea muscipula]